MIRLIALLFSLMAPGAGHIFIGHYVQGVLLGLLFVLGRSGLLPLALRVFKVRTEKNLLYAFYLSNWFYIVLILYAAISAFLQTKPNNQIHFLYALVSVICISIAYKKTFSRFIFTALCGRRDVYEFYLKNKRISTEKK